MRKQRDADNQIIRKCGVHLMPCMGSWHACTLKPSMPALNLSAPRFQKGSIPSSNLSNIRTAETLAEFGDATDRSGDIVRPVDGVQSKESMMMKGRVCRNVDAANTCNQPFLPRRPAWLWVTSLVPGTIQPPTLRAAHTSCCCCTIIRRPDGRKKQRTVWQEKGQRPDLCPPWHNLWTRRTLA